MDLLRDLGLNIPARLVEKWLLEELENTLVLFSAIVTLLAAAAFTLIFLPKSPDEQKPTKHTRRIESKMIQRVLRSFESIHPFIHPSIL